MGSHRVTVIIPAFNEALAIRELVSGIRALHPDVEIIVVDDGSSDNTAETAVSAGATVHRHPYNIGNGAAIRTGIRKAKGDVLVFMDGDGQHAPADIARLLEFIPEYDMVVGARSLSGQTSFSRALGNKAYNWLASYVTNFKVQDLTSGFRAVKSDLARRLMYLLPNTYSYPTTLTLSVLRNGRSIRYVPITPGKRTSGRSGIRIMRDGVRFFMIITKVCTLYSPLRVFLPVSFGMFVLGVVNYAYSYFTQGRFTNMSAFMFMSCVVIFMMGLVSEQIGQMRFESSEDDFRDTGRKR